MQRSRYTDEIIIFYDTVIFLINSSDNLSAGARGGSTARRKIAVPALSRALMGLITARSRCINYGHGGCDLINQLRNSVTKDET